MVDAVSCQIQQYIFFAGICRCLFLCEENNDFINGENITIDGGMTKKMIYVK